MDILKEIDLSFRVVPSRYVEKPDHRLQPGELTMQHALGKTRAAVLPAGKKPKTREIVLGADTVVYFEARMSGRVHYVYTGVALVERRTGETIVRSDQTKVKFRRWTRGRIASYVRVARSLDKAGGYAIQCLPSIVLSYQGSLSNVIGLPKELLYRMLRDMNSRLSK